jgi:hypothetical protein
MAKQPKLKQVYLPKNFPIKVSPLGIIEIKDTATQEHWDMLGKFVGYVETGIGWIQGDTINDAPWGDRQSKCEKYGWNYTTALNRGVVCKAFPMERRTKWNLSFSHFEAVLGVEEEVQDKLLTEAQDEELSVNKLRNRKYDIQYQNHMKVLVPEKEVGDIELEDVPKGRLADLPKKELANIAEKALARIQEDPNETMKKLKRDYENQIGALKALTKESTAKELQSKLDKERNTSNALLKQLGEVQNDLELARQDYVPQASQEDKPLFGESREDLENKIEELKEANKELRAKVPVVETSSLFDDDEVAVEIADKIKLKGEEDLINQCIEMLKEELEDPSRHYVARISLDAIEYLIEENNNLRANLELDRKQA